MILKKPTKTIMFAEYVISPLKHNYNIKIDSILQS